LTTLSFNKKVDASPTSVIAKSTGKDPSAIAKDNYYCMWPSFPTFIDIKGVPLLAG